MKRRSTRTLLAVTGIAVTGALALSGCAGSAGSGNNESGSSAGFEHGASQDEVDALLTELEPVTLKFQANAASQNSPLAKDMQPFMDEVKERSGGKITVEPVWGQAVAGWTEIDDALADGRLDLAYTINSYKPSEFPALAEFGKLTASFESTPLVSDLVINGALNEVAWSSPEYIGDFEDKGLTLLLPAALGAGYFADCTTPGTTTDAWGGRQVRSANAGQEKLLRDVGANPISLEYTETFEALQRNTIDCSILASVAAVQDGIIDVAPNMVFGQGHQWPRAQGEYVAGSSFKQLPLPYQQIIFDAMATTHAAHVKSFLDPIADAVETAKAEGGAVAPLEGELAEKFAASADELRQQAEDSGLLVTGGKESDFDAVVTKWEGIVEELGYEAGGDMADFDEWYDASTMDLEDFGQRVFDEVSLEHRPS